MDDTIWPDATREELRINPDIRARIHHDRRSEPLVVRTRKHFRADLTTPRTYSDKYDTSEL